MLGVNFHPFVGEKYYNSRYGARHGAGRVALW
jgi:hypothetical protein